MSSIPNTTDGTKNHVPWKKGRLIGPKPPLKVRASGYAYNWRNGPETLPCSIWRSIESFVAATSSNLRVRDVAYDRKAVPRATVMQQKTEQPVKFELSEQTRKTVEVRITKAQLT